MLKPNDNDIEVKIPDDASMEQHNAGKSLRSTNAGAQGESKQRASNSAKHAKASPPSMSAPTSAPAVSPPAHPGKGAGKGDTAGTPAQSSNPADDYVSDAGTATDVQKGVAKRRAKQKDMSNQLEDVRIGLSQLLHERRLESKERNIIMEVSPTSKALRKFLTEQQKVWMDARPEQWKPENKANRVPGQSFPHPKGEKHEYLWRSFLSYFVLAQNELHTMAAKAIKEGTAGTATSQPLQPNEEALLNELRDDQKSDIARFAPLSKGSIAPEGEAPWLWQIRFHVMAAHGPKHHRELLEHGTALFKCLQITFRADHCPIRGLERRIAATRSKDKK